MGRDQPTTGVRSVSRVTFGVLGPVAVVEDATVLDLGGPKQRAVLAMLIAHAGDPVSADSLIAATYGDDAAPNAKRRIQVYVSTLRGQLGERITKSGSGWVLDVDDDAIDARRFERLLRSGRDLVESSPETAAEVLREALSLWRGHPYADIEAHGALDGEIRRLEELRIAAQGARIDADLALGHHAELIGELDAFVIEHPYVESFRAQHMLALYRAGRQYEALRSYEQMRTVLVDELGVSPTPELQQLEQRILEQDDSLGVQPRRSIRRQAIVVADAGDPLELARLPEGERDAALTSVALALDRAIIGTGAEWIPSGLASYAVFDSVSDAMSIATKTVMSVDAADVRLAIDEGEVELGEGMVTGAPVARGAILAGSAHPGQVLVSSEAQQAFVSDGTGQRVRFELLGSYEFPGLAEAVPVYQLLTTDPPTEFPPLVTDRPPTPLPGGGHRSVPGYELREPIGPGSIGTLYRAYQPTVGREVIVEVIGRLESSGADFIRRFEADAQRLALLEHPNINPLIDYWRDTDGAYLVYHARRGGSLEAGDAVDGRRLVEQIGSALDHAHSFGLVHGSVRPDRVLLDESGNGYLIGFPLAGVGPRSSPDHPAYIAPEVLEGDPLTPASDVFALGVLAHELESGPTDADAAVVPESPVIARAIADDPSQRFPSIADFLRAWSPETDRPDARLTATRNPYKGLAAFHEADSGDFFGRDAAIDELIEAVTDSGFVAVVGPSGVGKSSVVRAGLVPAIRRGAIPGSDSWVVTDMLPGPRPFVELERALERVAVDVPVAMRELLAEQRPGALTGVADVLPNGSRLLVVIDQFEELFTMTDERSATAFLDLLRTAAAGDARFVVTLRADFLDRPLLYSDFGELLRSTMVTVRAPSRSELEQAIVRPARGVGVEFDPAVTERLVAEVHDEPGSLPLLQHALVELFDERSSDRIGPDDYERIGGVTGALARRAESIHTSLDEGAAASTEQLFLRLATVTDETGPTRRRARLVDLQHLEAEHAIDAFVRHRLLVVDHDPETRVPTVEVAHEALFTNWPRLAGWIDAARADLTLARRLDEAVRDWEENDRDDAYLLTGGRLAQHEAWTSTTRLTLTDREQDYLRESIERDRRVTRQRRRRRSWVTGAVAAAAFAALIFGIVAQREARRADESADLARTRELAGRARELVLEGEKLLGEDPQLATLLAVEAVASFRSAGQPVPSTATDLIRRAIVEHRTVGELPGGYFVDVSSDGTTLLTRGDGDGVALWDLETLSPVETLAPPDGTSVRTAWFWDGVVYAMAEDESTVEVVRRSDDGDWVRVAQGIDRGLADEVWLGGDARHFVARTDGVLRAWNTTGGREIDVGVDRPLWSADVDGRTTFDLSSDGRLAFAGPDGVIHLVDVASGAELTVIRPEPELAPTGIEPTFVLFSDDGSRLAALEGNTRITVYELPSGTVTWSYGDLPRGDFMQWADGDDQLVIAGETGVLRFDSESGELLGEVGPSDAVAFAVAAVPGSSLVAIAALDDTTTLVDLGLQAGRDVVDSFALPLEARWMAIADDGARLTALSQEDAVVVDLPTAAQRHLRRGLRLRETSPIRDVNFFTVPVMSIDGSYIASPDPDGRSDLWDAETGAVLYTAPDGWDIRAVGNRGDRVVIFRQAHDDQPSIALLVDGDGNEIDVPLEPEQPVVRGTFTPDDEAVVLTALESGVWSGESGERIGQIGIPDNFLGGFVDISREGEWIARASDGRLELYDGRGGLTGDMGDDRLVFSVDAANSAMSPFFSPDAAFIATVGRGEAVKVWSIDGELVATIDVEIPDAGAAFHPTESWVYVADGEDVTVYSLDVDELLAMAAADVWRSLTEEECQRYLYGSCDETAVGRQGSTGP